nr:MAG TPA: hypothetical protein [Crassvirales sp.]
MQSKEHEFYRLTDFMSFRLHSYICNLLNIRELYSSQ